MANIQYTFADWTGGQQQEFWTERKQVSSLKMFFQTLLELKKKRVFSIRLEINEALRWGLHHFLTIVTCKVYHPIVLPFSCINGGIVFLLLRPISLLVLDLTSFLITYNYLQITKKHTQSSSFSYCHLTAPQCPEVLSVSTVSVYSPPLTPQPSAIRFLPHCPAKTILIKVTSDLYAKIQ